VHVWCADLDRAAADAWSRLEPLLSAEERARAERFRFERDRRCYTTARGVLHQLLARYLDRDPARLRLRTLEHGKPVLESSASEPPLHFNLSHSGDLALYAFTTVAPTGVDVERIAPLADLEEIAARHFSPAERASLRALAADERREAFYRGWTRKEACLKATGRALTWPPERISVSLRPDEPARLIAADVEFGAPSRWSLHDLCPAPGFAAAVAVEGVASRVECWRWAESGGWATGSA
jgi:4'-phosphopantetheinyl transferase